MQIKKITLKVLYTCFLAFFVIVVGFSVIASGLKNVFKIYKSQLSEGIENTVYMDEVRKLVSQEILASSFYVLSTSDDVLVQYEKTEKDTREKLITCLSSFGLRMRGNEKEKLFQNISADCVGLLNEIQIAMNLRQSGLKSSAEGYVTENIVRASNDLNKKLENLATYTDSELVNAQKDMQHWSKILNLSFFIVSVLVFISFMILILVCVRFTSQLEHNNSTLQDDVDKKADEIAEKTKEIIHIQEQTIYGMANLIENRDSDTGEHVKRTSLYVEVLGKAAEKAGYHSEIINDEYVELLKKAAPMHDIGKISIPDSILKKPGKLTEEEAQQVQNHTIAGGKIIKEVLSGIESDAYVEIACDVARSHHERWDGCGYPEQLKGEEIPLGARIMAIADVFDALVSPRCYKDAFSAEEAFNIISISKGTHFDPILADLFLGEKNEIMKVLRNS